MADEANLARYIAPPSYTCHRSNTLHLLGDVRGKTILEYAAATG